MTTGRPAAKAAEAQAQVGHVACGPRQIELQVSGDVDRPLRDAQEEKRSASSAFRGGDRGELPEERPIQRGEPACSGRDARGRVAR